MLCVLLPRDGTGAGGKQERESSTLLGVGSGKASRRGNARAESLPMNRCLLNSQGGYGCSRQRKEHKDAEMRESLACS